MTTFVTQQYIEVAGYPTAPPDAVVTQQYIEVAYVEAPPSIPAEASDSIALSDSSTASVETPGNFELSESLNINDEAFVQACLKATSDEALLFGDSASVSILHRLFASDRIKLSDQISTHIVRRLYAEDVFKLIEEIKEGHWNTANGAIGLKLLIQEPFISISPQTPEISMTVHKPFFKISVQNPEELFL